MAQPNLDLSRAAERRLDDYLDALAGALGHADRTGPARAYCTGLLLPGARKSIEPLAARLAPQTGAGGPPVAASPGRQGGLER